MKETTKNIVLIGMPGCGKSTIGAKAAAILGKTFYDADSLIEEREGKTISEIFSLGEDYFRRIETQTILSLSSEENCIISTGGGVIKNEYNIELLKMKGILIFIDRPINDILEDIDTDNRPLLRNKKETLLKLYDERIELYRKYSDKQIANDKSIEDTIEKLIEFCGVVI